MPERRRIGPDARRTRPGPVAGRRPPRPPNSAAPGEGLVLLAEIGRAQGLSGEVRLRSHTGDPLAVASYGPLVAGDGRPVTLRSVRPAPGGRPELLIARIDGVGDRDAAEALAGTPLYAHRDQLGSAEEDEFFLVDLVGLRAEDESGAELGTVVAVPDFGGGELLEIASPGGPSRLIPFAKAFVPTVDLAAGRIVVVPPVEAEGDEEAPSHA